MLTIIIQTDIVIYIKSNYNYYQEEHNMIVVLSTVIACILTALLACFLYPIAGLFWFLGKVGDIVGIIGNWIFTHANAAIKHLWADLRNSSKGTSDNKDNNGIID